MFSQYFKETNWVIDKKNNIRLLIRLPQSGKTKIMLEEITDFIETCENPLVIVICDNSLLLTTQTYKRGTQQRSVKIGSIFSNANGYCKWKKVYSYDNPKAEKDNEFKKKKQQTLENRINKNDINTLVMCSNKTRWDDIGELIDMFKATHKIVIWIDEADKTVGGIDSNTSASKDKIKLLKNWSNIVESINLITATPFTPKRNWSTLSWIGNHFNDNMELVKIPEIVGINYHHLCNSHYYQQEKESGDSPSQYAMKYLDKYPPCPGDIFLIPGTTLQSSHDEIKDMCLYDSGFDYVIILNSKTKSIQQESGDIIIHDNNNFKQTIKTNEVSVWLAKWYTDNNIKNKKIAITGNLCISRGITISSDKCQITHMIFSSNSTIREEDQLLSRVCGYCYTNNIIPKVICEKDVWSDVSKYQKVMIKLSKIAICDNRNDRILSTEKLNSIINDIDENKRRPYMFENLDMNKYGNLFKCPLMTNHERKNMVMEIIRENNTSLYNFINHSKCKQITQPGRNKELTTDLENTASYKKHVIDVYKKYKENKNFIIDFTPEDKEDDCWQGIIDSINNRLFIIVWVVKSTLI